MNAAIYARKSSDEDDDAHDDAKSVPRQVTGARAFITNKGWALDDAHVYTDDGVSGALFLTRPEFQRLMRDADAGAFGAVVFFDLDRFGRNARHTYAALNTLADLGITIWDFSTGQQVDLDSFEGDTMTFMKARFAQQYQAQVRKHTRSAMRRIAERGCVTGCNTFGYDIIGETKGQKEWRINDAQAAVVRDIYARYAAGDGARSIAEVLNAAKVPFPRAQQGRARGWSVSTIRAVIERSMYRGQIVFGRTAAAYGRELGQRKTKDGKPREHGQIPAPRENLITVDAPRLRIVDANLAERCDARRLEMRTRYLASVKQKGKDGKCKVPERAHGKYLLTGGMLICPTCNGHFERYKAPWKKGPDAEVYLCATRRRKPGACTNTLMLPVARTDDIVLDTIAGDVLHPKYITELLRCVDQGTALDYDRLTADRERLQVEVTRLVTSIASGVPAATVAPLIREREAEIAKLDARLRAPRQAPPDMERLRQALTLRAEQWKADLKNEVKVARLLLRRLVGPLTLWEASSTDNAWVTWEASIKPEALLDGAIQLVASPPGFEPGSRP